MNCEVMLQTKLCSLTHIIVVVIKQKLHCCTSEFSAGEEQMIPHPPQEKRKELNESLDVPL